MNQYLDIILRNNKLTWHDGMIPEDEIWVKIGGEPSHCPGLVQGSGEQLERHKVEVYTHTV